MINPFNKKKGLGRGLSSLITTFLLVPFIFKSNPGDLVDNSVLIILLPYKF